MDLLGALQDVDGGDVLVRRDHRKNNGALLGPLGSVEVSWGPLGSVESVGVAFVAWVDVGLRVKEKDEV